MKRKIIAGLLILASMMTMAGCTNNNVSNTGNNNGNNNGKNGVVSDDEKNRNGSEISNSGTANYEFENRELGGSNVVNSSIVTDLIAQANAGSNVMYSPTSLNMALAMAGEGGNENAKALINSFLGTDNYSDRANTLMTNFEDYNSESEYWGYSNKLEVANALWVDKRLKLNKDFEAVVKNSYQANADEVDFTKPDNACNKINDWAKDKTHGLIPQILSPDVITTDTRMVITNSLYFESAWSEAWTLKNNEEDFTLIDGSTQQINYITSEGGAYYENDYATAFSCSYMSGIRFIGILPKEEGDFNLEDLDIEGLLKTESYSHDELYYKMPRLNFETSNDLNNVFKALGMESLFAEGAGFDGIADNEALYISSIIQKTKLELDENGTKAAAVTAITMDCESCAEIEEEPVIKRVYLDRPFAFLIYDRENDEILFMGKVVTAE